MNSSALSDDGKFSTRALRGFGTSDLDYPINADHQIRMERRGDVGDGMGLSTMVEISDRGSRRHAHHHNEERIDEVEDESGRTSPPGTIGEAHEYMSENIESNVMPRIKKAAGNQSVKGANGQQTVSNIARDGQKFERADSSVTACSNFAVIREKIRLTDNNKHVQIFKHKYDQLFAEFQAKLTESYSHIKEEYILEYQANYQMNVNEK
jgi:hypothetical protein